MNQFAENSFIRYPEQTAAVMLAEAQHAPGVSCRMNPRTYRIEYLTADGELVPNYSHFLNLALHRHGAA